MFCRHVAETPGLDWQGSSDGPVHQHPYPVQASITDTARVFIQIADPDPGLSYNYKLL